MHHQSSKLNFDSGLRRLRKDLTKWRYMVIGDEAKHEEFRKNVETSEPTVEYQEKIERAEKILWEVEKMIRVRFFF